MKYEEPFEVLQAVLLPKINPELDGYWQLAPIYLLHPHCLLASLPSFLPLFHQPVFPICLLKFFIIFFMVQGQPIIELQVVLKAGFRLAVLWQWETRMYRLLIRCCHLEPLIQLPVVLFILGHFVLWFLGYRIQSVLISNSLVLFTGPTRGFLLFSLGRELILLAGFRSCLWWVLPLHLRQESILFMCFIVFRELLQPSLFDHWVLPLSLYFDSFSFLFPCHPLQNIYGKKSKYWHIYSMH